MQPTEENEMELVEGELIEQIEQTAEEWWSGVSGNGKAGLFPANYVEIVESVEPEQHQDDNTAVAAVPPPPV